MLPFRQFGQLWSLNDPALTQQSSQAIALIPIVMPDVCIYLVYVLVGKNENTAALVS